MKEHAKTPAEAAELRCRAESRLREKKKAEATCPRTAEDTQRLVHELEVHQIELEIQNEELRQARAEVEVILGQYTDLYDFAPVGYFTLDRQGTIRQVNLTGTRLLGVDRSGLVSRRFGLFVSEDSRPAFNTFLDRAFASPGKESCEVKICRVGPDLLWAHIEARVAENGQECFAAVVVITDRKRGDEVLRQSRDFAQAILDSVASHIVVLDRNGVIVAVNERWRRFALENPDENRQPARRTEVGVNYLDVCRESVGLSSEGAMAAHDGIRAVLDGRLPSFTLEYACHSPTLERWFTMTVTPLSTPGTGVVISHVNIAERKKAEKAAAFRTVLLEAQTEASLDGILLVDDQRRAIPLNRRFGEMWRLPQGILASRSDKEILQLTARQLKHPAEFLEGVEYLYTQQAEKSYDQLELADGRVFDRYSSPLMGQRGEYYGRVWYFRDITTRKRVEGALRELTTAVEQSMDGIALTDLGGHIRFVNGAWAKMHGYSVGELIGRHMGIFHTKEQLATEVNAFNERLVKTGSQEGEIGHARRDGTTFPTWMSSTVVTDADQKPFGLIGIARDISDRKQAEQAMKAAKTYTDNIIRSMADMLVVVSPDGTIATVNKATCQALGYAEGELIGQPATLLFEEEEDTLESILAQYPLPVKRTVLRHLVKEGAVNNVEKSLRTKTGNQILVLLSGAIMRDDMGSIRGIVCLALDISDRKRAEDRLRESEERFRTVFDQQYQFMAMLTPEGRVLEVNNLPLQVQGCSREDCIGKFFWEAPAWRDLPEWQERIRNRVTEAQTTHEAIVTEEVFRAADGTVRYTDAAYTAVRDEDGELRFIIVQAQDVTERKLAELALHTSERKYRTLFDSVPDAVFVHEVTEEKIPGPFLDFNQAACDRLGYTPEELRQFAPMSLDLPEVIEEVAPVAMLEVLAKGFAIFESVQKAKDGRCIPVENYTRLVLEGDRRLLLTVCRDISERKRVEDALRAGEQSLRRAQEIGHLGNWEWDIAGEKLVWSDELYRIWGVSRDFPLTYDNIVSLIHPEDRELNVAKVKELLDSASRVAYEFRIIRPDGSIRHVHQEGELSRDDVGTAVRAFGIMQDITEHKRAEDQLQAANVRLEQAVARAEELAVRAEAANRAKSEFLANMSHEIRTPMSAITGFAELLMSGECSARERREHLSTIQRNAESLLTIINDILDLSKIEAERLQLEQMDWPPRQVVEDVVTSLRGRANEKHLSLEVTFVDPLPSVIRTDPVRLRQILVNLVGNAIKFADSGSVHLTVRWTPGKGARSQMQFEVADSGIGISAEGMQGLFEPFSQVDMSSTRRFGGTGLGLSISQRLAEMLGGRIEARSELGNGSTFTLTIDAGPAEKAALPASSSAPRRAEDRPLAEVYGSLHGRVLLVEDVPEMTHLMRCILAKTHLELELAENGVVACEKAMASQAAGEPYDLILMDIRMPVMNGYEATRRLRAEGWVGPIVALTAHSMHGDREQCLEAGCNDYLSKPVSQAAFFGVLERYLGGKDQSADELPEPANPSRLPAEGKLFDGLLDDATVDQLLEEYAATLLVKAEALAGALTAHDLDLLAGLAHELKGVAGMYGFAQVSEKARFLQQLAENSNDLAEVEAQAFELIEFCRRAAQAGRKNSQRPHEQVNDSLPPSSSP